MKGILLLFYEPYTAGTRDSERALNADVNEVKVDINGIPNMLFSQGINLTIKRATEGSGNVNCNIFILSDAQYY